MHTKKNYKNQTETAVKVILDYLGSLETFGRRGKKQYYEMCIESEGNDGLYCNRKYDSEKSLIVNSWCTDKNNVCLRKVHNKVETIVIENVLDQFLLYLWT